MNFLVSFGLIIIFYMVLQYFLFRNKYEVERLEFIILLVPFVIFFENSFKIKQSIIEWIITFIATYILTFFLTIILIKFVGLQMQINSEFEKVKLIFDRDKNYKRIDSGRNNFRIKYTDKENRVVKIARRNSNMTDIILSTKLRGILKLRKEIVKKLIPIDQKINNNFFIKGILIGIVLIFSGVILIKFF